MKQGIVMDVDGRFLTVLTPDGEFVRTKRVSGREQIGEEILFSPQTAVHRLQELRTAITRKPSVLGSILAASLLLIFFTVPQNAGHVYAYMSIDVNPSVELALNKELEVVEMRSYNEEGEDIISELENWKNASVEDVTEKVFNVLEKKGYLDKGEDVVVGTVVTEEPQEVVKQLETVIATVTKDYEADVQTVIATEKEREQAVNQGITAGSYKKEVDSKQAEKRKEKEAPVETTHPNQQKVPVTPDLENNQEGKKKQDNQVEEQITPTTELPAEHKNQVQVPQENKQKAAPPTTNGNGVENKNKGQEKQEEKAKLNKSKQNEKQQEKPGK